MSSIDTCLISLWAHSAVIIFVNTTGCSFCKKDGKVGYFSQSMPSFDHQNRDSDNQNTEPQQDFTKLLVTSQWLYLSVPNFILNFF